MMTIKESGVYDKALQTGVDLSYEFFPDKDFLFNCNDQEKGMVLDQMKIAVGPYMCGTAIALMYLIIEIIKNYMFTR